MVVGDGKFKVIKDLVHGYIKIDEFEERIVNSAHFQRLKDIKQLTAQYVYPSANHTRFEHSLGVMHLAKKALEHLRPQLKHYFEKDSIPKEKFNFLYKNLTVAALLHDIGHAPFSHLGEKYYRRTEIISNLKSAVASHYPGFDKEIFRVGAPHELMSCLIILTKFREELKDPNDVLDAELICRCIVGKKHDNNSEAWPENIVIDLLNSPGIDMDKLDYLIRDSYMTGVGLPPIDVNRLFMNVYINPNNNTITYKSNALSEIQNIVDARDSLYLWVVNHHIVVYTDFAFELYIKHLIYNYEKNNQYNDKLNPYEFFSCSAIIDQLISDSHLYYQLKLPLKYLSCNNKVQNISDYTHRLFPQLFQRQFLKPLWKTIYEYRIFLKEQIQDDGIIIALAEKLCDSEDYAYRRYFAEEIMKACNLQRGQIFIIPRSNKFYFFNQNDKFTLHINGNNKLLENLLPQKRFEELYDNVAFYIFAPEGKQGDVKKAFIELAKQPLPDKNKIKEGLTELEWFKDEKDEDQC